MRYNLLVGLLVLLAGFSSVAHADGRPANISWPNWRVSSSENWNFENGKTPSFPFHYPMTYLFDGDATTTWVHHDIRPSHDKSQNPLYDEKRPRQLTITSGKPRWMSEIALMNGYNRRADLFKSNDRIVEIAIEINDKFVKRARLSDEMDWHRIRFPRQKVSELTIRFIGIRKGDGPDNDICISELALLDGTRKIEMNMPSAVLFSISGCCGGTGYVINQHGKLITEGGFGDGLSLEWSSSGKHLAGVNRNFVWVVDMNRGRIVLRDKIPLKQGKLIWHGEKFLEYSNSEFTYPKLQESVTYEIPK